MTSIDPSKASKHSRDMQASSHRREKHLGSPRDKVEHGNRVIYTLAACNRCRNRKTRCDPGLPRCDPCARSNAACEYLDSAKGKIVSRTYVLYLQKKLERLEATLNSLSTAAPISTDRESTVRGAGFVRFKEHDEPRILGPSSGIAVTRLVMELAKQNTNKRSIRDIVPEFKAQQIRARFSQEEKKPTSKVYPLISDVAAPNLPTRELTNSLVELFNRKAQYLLPILHEPSFQNVIDDVYQGDTDAYKNFTLRMVIAISMQKLDAQYAGLADSYYLAALPFLEQVIRAMNLGTLQCFAMIGQYSLLTPTRTAAYWVVGFAARLCQELGITEESSIVLSNDGKTMANALQIDMRRRLFWIITSMEMALAHTLGRPSAFGTTCDHLNVAFFEPIDDEFITGAGIHPNAPPSIKKLCAIHFLKMRLLQAEIRRKLYLKKRPEPENEEDPWFLAMEIKLSEWLKSTPTPGEGSQWVIEWFTVRYNTIVVFLHRPSPQIPEPSARSAVKCFNAAVYNIHRQREHILSKLVDLTWVAAQSLYMALNTILWALSYPKVRAEHPKEEVQEYINTAIQTILLTSERWPGVESAAELYDHLITACLASYGPEKGEVKATVKASIDLPQAPQEIHFASSSDGTSPEIINDIGLSPGHPKSVPSVAGYTPPTSTHFPLKASPESSIVGGRVFEKQDSRASSETKSFASPETEAHLSLYGEGAFDPTSVYNSFPAMPPAFNFDGILSQDTGSYPSLIGDQYSQYFHAPFATQYSLDTLNHDQQVELMNDLECGGLGNAI